MQEHEVHVTFRVCGQRMTKGPAAKDHEKDGCVGSWHGVPATGVDALGIPTWSTRGVPIEAEREEQSRWRDTNRDRRWAGILAPEELEHFALDGSHSFDGDWKDHLAAAGDPKLPARARMQLVQRYLQTGEATLRKKLLGDPELTTEELDLLTEGTHPNYRVRQHSLLDGREMCKTVYEHPQCGANSEGRDFPSV